MIVCKTKAEFEEARAGLKGRVAFVPTMGALHDGHLSLVTHAKKEADSVVVSIYVNPTQFAPGEDFDSYPREIKRDVSLLKEAGVDCVYLPQDADIYPNGPAPHLKATDFGDAATGLEAEFRPHFFDGVCSVVHRLFEIVKPDVAMFGEKDYQQLMVIREMVAGLGLPIEVVGAPIVRDEFGLALSSRNAYLGDEQLEIARKLNASLRVPGGHKLPRSNPSQEPTDGAGDGLPRRPDGLLAMTEALKALGFDKVDYIEKRWGRILAAAWIGNTRLIDNRTTEMKE